METWWNNLAESCKDYSLEPVYGQDGTVYIIGSKLPDYSIRDIFLVRILSKVRPKVNPSEPT